MIPRTVLALLGASALASPALAQQDPAPQPPLAGLQFLYGSGESAGLSRQIYRGLEFYALARAAERPRDSVVLTAGSSLAEPTYEPCGDKPLAVVFDIDETVILNSGLMYARAAGEAARDPEIRQVPGAVQTILALSGAGITPIYNTNRTVDMTGLVTGYLMAVGLEAPVPEETLFLNGSDDMGGNKDGRRSRIAANWCVIAMVGDQLGDFSEHFNHMPSVGTRRHATLASAVEGNWGKGWFLLPNTAYGMALAGDLEEIFAEPEGGRE
jgi:hypothetical protein